MLIDILKPTHPDSIKSWLVYAPEKGKVFIWTYSKLTMKTRIVPKKIIFNTVFSQNQMKNDPRSYDRNFCNCVKKPDQKNSGLQRGWIFFWIFLNFKKKSWIFFRLLYAIAKIAIITARIILYLISYLQFTYDLFHMHHSQFFLFCGCNHDNYERTSQEFHWI